MRTRLIALVATALVLGSTASAQATSRRGAHRLHHLRAQVASIPLPSPMPAIIKAGCPGLEDANCYVGVNDVDASGHQWPNGAVFTTGDRFATLHELGHAFDATRMDAAERRSFARAIDRTLEVWTYAYTDEAGRLIQYPGSLAETFADAYANCRLRHVVAPGAAWEAGYNYFPTAQEHLRACRVISSAADDPGTPVSPDGSR